VGKEGRTATRVGWEGEGGKPIVTHSIRAVLLDAVLAESIMHSTNQESESVSIPLVVETH
jgi:hypothetical protein